MVRVASRARSPLTHTVCGAVAGARVLPPGAVLAAVWPLARAADGWRRFTSCGVPRRLAARARGCIVATRYPSIGATYLRPLGVFYYYMTK